MIYNYRCVCLYEYLVIVLVSGTELLLGIPWTFLNANSQQGVFFLC